MLGDAYNQKRGYDHSKLIMAHFAIKPLHFSDSTIRSSNHVWSLSSLHVLRCTENYRG